MRVDGSYRPPTLDQKMPDAAAGDRREPAEARATPAAPWAHFEQPAKPAGDANSWIGIPEFGEPKPPMHAIEIGPGRVIICPGPRPMPPPHGGCGTPDAMNRWNPGQIIRDLLALIKMLIAQLTGGNRLPWRDSGNAHLMDARQAAQPGGGKAGGAAAPRGADNPNAAGDHRGVHKPNPGGPVGHHGGVNMDGPNGFLWKPTSDSDGKLAILTPEKLTGQVASVVVTDAAGKVIDKGRMSGVGNGDREHFRFGKPGEAYPPNCMVEIRLKDGTVQRYQIPDPSQRYD